MFFTKQCRLLNMNMKVNFLPKGKVKWFHRKIKLVVNSHRSFYKCIQKLPFLFNNLYISQNGILWFKLTNIAAVIMAKLYLQTHLFVV